jgi:hypothetical protein
MRRKILVSNLLPLIDRHLGGATLTQILCGLDFFTFHFFSTTQTPFEVARALQRAIKELLTLFQDTHPVSSIPC